MQNSEVHRVVDLCRDAAERMVAEKIQWRLDPRYILLLCDALTAALSDKQAGEVQAEYSHEDRVTLASCLSWDINEITPSDVKGILERLEIEGYRLVRSALVDVPAGERINRATDREIDEATKKVPAPKDWDVWTRGKSPSLRAEQGEPVGYLRKCDLARFDPNGAEIKDALLCPRGTLRPDNEVAVYTSPPLSREGEDNAEVKDADETVQKLCDMHGKLLRVLDEKTGLTFFMADEVSSIASLLLDAATKLDRVNRAAPAATRSGSATDQKGIPDE